MRELFSDEASSKSKDTSVLSPSNSKEKNEKLDVKSLTKEELLAYCAKRGWPRFRANQLFQWLYQKARIVPNA